MKPPKQIEKLAKLLRYVLGRRPDEFGLVTDDDGFVKIKELLKAINEEAGWRHVRRAHIDEMAYSLPRAPVEIVDSRIRAKDRQQLPAKAVAHDPPKLLYTCVRQRAHAHVVAHGIEPGADDVVVLCADTQMADRIGRRIDANPVRLTVQVAQSHDWGLVFRQAGEGLYLADAIPVGCFSAPPLPKEKPGAKKTAETEKPARNREPGSFRLDLGVDPTAPKHEDAARQGRAPVPPKYRKKEKRKRRRPPWRS